MSVDLSIAEQKSYQAFLDAFDLLDRIRDCVLFPPKFDFSGACPCTECGSKIAKLKEFQIEITTKKHLVMKHIVQLENKMDICLGISSSVEWKKRMLDIFHKKLKVVSKKSGIPLSLEKSSSDDYLGDIYLNILQKLVDCEMSDPEPVETKVPDDADDNGYESYDVFDEIDRGRFYYGQTKAMDTAFGILSEIEDIEKDHGKKMESAEAQKNMLDPSVSKNYIENQFELVKKLPVKELKIEFDELISEIHPRRLQVLRNEKALEDISNTCYVIIKKMKEFWKESPKGNEHISNGWEQILDSLINKAKSFKEEWKKDYAPFYTPYDRSDPKRQAT